MAVWQSVAIHRARLVSYPAAPSSPG